MSSALSPFPTHAMPELPTTGNSPVGYASPLPTQEMPALDAAAAPLPAMENTRPVMPALPALTQTPEAAVTPTWSAVLPCVPSTTSFPAASSGPAMASPFSPIPFGAAVQPVPHTAVQAVASPQVASQASIVAPVASPLAPRNASAAVFSATPTPAPQSAAPAYVLPPLEREESRLDYTDADLLAVFRPLVQDAVQHSLFSPGGGMDTYLEPMLRATIRRALAEHSPHQVPFQEPGFLDRFAWRVRALFSSRTYEEIFFEKTKRFRVEEVFLLEKINLAMISYASSDPARHASAKRVIGTARRLADGALDKEGTIRLFFELPEGRHAIVREGKESLLVAVVLGSPQDGLRIDLDYTLRRIEERFGSRMANPEDPLLLSIQPHLEDCLLIIAPSSGV